MALADTKMILGILFMLINMFFLSTTLTTKVRFVGQDSIFSVFNLIFFFVITAYFSGCFIINFRYYTPLGFTRKELINNLYLIYGVIVLIISFFAIIHLNSTVGNGEKFLFFSKEMEKVGVLSSLLVFINSFIMLYFICSLTIIFHIHSNKKVAIFILIFNAAIYFDKTGIVIKIFQFLTKNILINLPMNSFLLLVINYFSYKVSLNKITKIDIL
ncbi:hypothetical protein [Clostridium malenominatum]|uniref:hypothetical protein n=1 Tax=Clostridium malenominatum TaxID=1539 RepID=UPI0031E2A912